MKILYDHLAFMERAGGVSRYFSQMIPCLDQDIEYYIAIKFSSNLYLPQISRKKIIPFIKTGFPHKDRIYSELNKPNSIREIKYAEYDVYHMTHCDPFGFKYLPPNKKKVMTVHDLNFIVLPGIVKNNFSLKVWQETSAHIVDKIITVSENTKKDIIKYWHIPENKIKVIYHGKPEIDLNTLPKERIISKPYILYVGSRANFKNFDKLVLVFSKIKKKYDDILLVCTGSPFSQKEKDFLNTLTLSDSVLHYAATDIQLYTLYNQAVCYVYPSYYEGFGLPLLEAMTCACPVACSYASCFPEIASDAAEYFDPNSENEMYNSLEKIISTPSYQKELKKRGAQNINRFSWEQCGKEHSDFYKNL